MNTLKKMTALGLMLGTFAGSVYAIEAVAPAALTLAQFQRTYAGTKPVVAFEKYAQATSREQYPQVTLNVSSMRFDVPQKGNGTKPLTTPTKGVYTKWAAAARDSGTKPIVAR